MKRGEDIRTTGIPGMQEIMQTTETMEFAGIAIPIREMRVIMV
jgi:hypothetical protein